LIKKTQIHIFLCKANNNKMMLLLNQPKLRYGSLSNGIGWKTAYLILISIAMVSLRITVKVEALKSFVPKHIHQTRISSKHVIAQTSRIGDMYTECKKSVPFLTSLHMSSIQAATVETMSDDHELEGNRMSASIAAWLDLEVRCTMRSA